jgi:TRAP-type C4-dicarboxylate transport system permease small subunit
LTAPPQGSPLKSRPKLEEWLGVACMVALTLITLGNVLVRYLSDQSFAWTEEISVFLIVVMTLAGAAGVARRDGHIRIEYVYVGGSIVRRRRLRLLAAVATALSFLALAVLFGATVADEIRWAETSMGLGVPRWWFTVAIPPLCLAIAARAAQAGWQAWREDPVPADPADHQAPL